MSRRWMAAVLMLGLGIVAAVVAAAWAQTSSGGVKTSVGNSDLELVERVLVTRREYQSSLEQLRAHYLKVGDQERAKWVEEELRGYHMIVRQAFRLELDVPPPTLQGTTNIVEANKLYTEALKYKDKGWGNDYILNQRRAEILFQRILTQHPQSNKISDVAYMLGDIYEGKANRQFRRAALYFERCVQWNPQTQQDARIRAARLYDRQLQERGRAIELYREITTHETDPRRIQEAGKRLTELSGTR